MSDLAGGEDVTAVRTEEAGLGPRALLQFRRSARRFWSARGHFSRPLGWWRMVAIWVPMFCRRSAQSLPDGEAEERARRRHKQLKDKGMDVSLAALSRDIEDRDRRDSERSVAPLRPAEDARILDSSGQSIEAVTQTVLDWVANL